MPDLWEFWSISDPWWQFWSKWYKKIILDVSHRDQTEVQWDPTKARNAWFAAFWSTFDAHAPSGANWLKPKKSYWEEKDGVRWEKSWDLSSGSRRGWEFLQTNCEKSAIISLVWRREGESLQIFSSFEKTFKKIFSSLERRKINFANKSHNHDRGIKISIFCDEKEKFTHQKMYFCFIVRK